MDISILPENKPRISHVSIVHREFASYMQVERFVAVSRVRKGVRKTKFYYPGQQTIERLESLLTGKVIKVTSEMVYYDLTR